ncbi:hypothetical protein OHC33_009946 [Knufia fluminis]|uniref:Uncharacterized protein n=1 Tax=Knufia fluminis TaxID=191047 RepID=A0AAN8I3V8_9EURO|nr:hypothetical protein OHC33_009946 [Knufia fluminis]
MPASDPDSVNCRTVLADRKLVPDEQIRLFCDILFMRFNVGEGLHDEYARTCYINRIRPQITKLRFPLARPHGVVRKLLLPEQSKYTYLCDIHCGLNADFVHQWFKFLALEVGARMEILRSSSQEHVGVYAWHSIIKPLTRLHKMWLTPEQVREAFGDFVETGFDPQITLIDAKRQADGCEACILARIAEHPNTLWALHTLIKSRITPESHERHPTRLRLLRLIDPWIQLYQDRYMTAAEVASMKQKEASNGLAEELYEKRQEIKLEQHRQRRAQRKLLDVRYSGSKKYKDLVKDLDEKALDENLYDAEHDIIDHYAALRASQRASALIVAGNIDAAASSSSVGTGPYLPYQSKSKASPASSSASATIRGQPYPSPYAPKSNMEYNKAYQDSRYSINTIRNNERALTRHSILQHVLMRWPHLKDKTAELDALIPHVRPGHSCVMGQGLNSGWTYRDHSLLPSGCPTPSPRLSQAGVIAEQVESRIVRALPDTDDTPPTHSGTTNKHFWSHTLPSLISELASQEDINRRSMHQYILKKWPHLKQNIPEIDRLIPHKRSGRWVRLDRELSCGLFKWRDYSGLLPPNGQEQLYGDTEGLMGSSDLSLSISEGREKEIETQGQRPQDQESRYTDIPVLDSPSFSSSRRASTISPVSTRNAGRSRSSTVSAVSSRSSYSAYYQRNGARGYANQPSNLRFEARLSRPFDEPAATGAERPEEAVHEERYR